MRGSIVERKNVTGQPLYCLVIRGKWNRVPGKQTRKNAPAYQARLITEIQQGEATTSRNITVSKLLEEWRTVVYNDPERPLPPGTRSRYDYHIAHLTKHLGDRSIKTITVRDVDRLTSQLSQTLVISTIAHIKVLLFRAFDLAVEYRSIHRSPISARQRRRKQARTERQEKKLHCYDYDQLQTFLTYLTALNTSIGIEWRALLLFAVCGGPKNGKVRAARRTPCDSEDRSYTFVEQFVRDHGTSKILQADLKAQSSHATVSLPAIC